MKEDRKTLLQSDPTEGGHKKKAVWPFLFHSSLIDCTRQSFPPHQVCLPKAVPLAPELSPKGQAGTVHTAWVEAGRTVQMVRTQLAQVTTGLQQGGCQAGMQSAAQRAPLWTWQCAMCRGGAKPWPPQAASGGPSPSSSAFTFFNSSLF